MEGDKRDATFDFLMRVAYLLLIVSGGGLVLGFCNPIFLAVTFVAGIIFLLIGVILLIMVMRH